MMEAPFKQGDKVRIPSVDEIDFASEFFDDGAETTVLRVSDVNDMFQTVQLVVPWLPKSEVGFTVTPSEFHALVLIEEAEDDA